MPGRQRRHRPVRADPLPLRAVGRAARAVPGVLDRAVRRPLGGHALRRHPPRAAGAGDVLQRVDDRQRPEPGVHVHPDVPRSAGARQVPHALQRPLLPGHGHAGHAGGPRGGQPLHRRLHRRRRLRVHDARSPTRSRPTCSSTPSTCRPPTRRSSCAGCTRCSAGSAARSRRPVVDAQARDARLLQGDVRPAARPTPEDPEVDILTYLLSADGRRRADPRGRPAQHGGRARARRPRHHQEPARLQLPPSRHPSRGPGPPRRRPVADADGDRGAAAVPRLRAAGTQAEAGRRVRGLPDEGRPDGADAAVVGDTAIPARSRTPPRCRSTARPTATSPSAPARTAAPAPTWRAASCSWRWRSGTPHPRLRDRAGESTIIEHGWQCGPDNLPLVWS